MEEKSIKLTESEALFIKELVCRNDGLIRNLLKTLLAEKYDVLADECISETHLLACEKAALLKTHPNPDGWIIKTVKLKAYELKRLFLAEKRLTLEKAAELTDTQDVYEEALYVMLKESFCREELLPRLTKREKQVFSALFVEKIGTAATAVRLGISEKTVNNLKRLIISKAKKLLE